MATIHDGNGQAFSASNELPTRSLIRDALSVVPSDTVDLSKGVSRGLYIGGTGNIAVILSSGTQITLNSIPVGFTNLSVSRVLSTGTSATNIVALY